MYIVLNRFGKQVFVHFVAYSSVFPRSRTTARYAIVAMSALSPVACAGTTGGQTMKKQKGGADVSYSLCKTLFRVMYLSPPSSTRGLRASRI